MKTLVLGIGNPILTDDGAGIKVAQKLKENKPGLEVVETSEVGIALLDHVVGYDKLILIDSIIDKQRKFGECYRLNLEDLKPSMGFCLSHGVDMATAFDLGGKLGYSMPQHISIYAVVIKDNMTFGEECVKEVKEMIPLIAKRIIEEEKL